MLTRDLLFFPAGGLGDCFVFSGIIRHYAEKYPDKKIFLPTHKGFMDTIECLYQDDNNIIPILHENDQDTTDFVNKYNLDYLPYLYHHHFRIEIDGELYSPLWDEQFYMLFDLPFSLRYTNFKLPNHIKNSKRLYNRLVKKRYILTHRGMGNTSNKVDIDLKMGRDINLEDYQIIDLDPSLSTNMLDYIDLIRDAEEIHCVPSSVYCLVDSIIKLTKAELFYHDIRKGTVMRINNKYNNHRWNVVKYAIKL